MDLLKKIAVLMILAAIELPCAAYAAEEDRELALIAAEQEKNGDDERLGDINPALTDSITTKRTQDTDKDKKERKKKLRQSRKEKEKDNERKLAESTKREDTKRTETPRSTEQIIIIDPNEPPGKAIRNEEFGKAIRNEEFGKAIRNEELGMENEKNNSTFPIPNSTLNSPPPTETVRLPDQKIIYANFSDVARAVHFIPLYIPRKSGYEITGIYAGQGVAEIRYGRRWEPTVSLAVKTYRRAAGEQLQDISGITGVKWRVDTTTGTTIYIAKISETQQVAAWAVGQFTFSAQSENLSFAGFHSLIADELVELSTHYYLDL